jgi:hypothetical protein
MNKSQEIANKITLIKTQLNLAQDPKERASLQKKLTQSLLRKQIADLQDKLAKMVKADSA